MMGFRLLLTIFVIGNLVKNCQPQRYLPCISSVCPNFAYCVDLGGSQQICACRGNRRFSNGSWPQSCNASFVPLGLSTMEGNGEVSPDFHYSMIPASMMSASNSLSPSYPAKLGRLQEKTSSDAAWCAPNGNNQDYLQIDLGVVSTVRMIAIQGVGQQPISTYTKSFVVKYSLDQSTWYNVSQNDSGIAPAQVFGGSDATSGNEGVVFNIFEHPINGRYFRTIPLDYKFKKCIRIEFFGNRVFNECSVAAWNICDKNHAICTDSFAAYSCRCMSGYKDFTNQANLCIEIDECTENTHRCSQYSKCSNTPGSYTCSCNPGYDGDGYHCEDRNECASNPCHPDATCTNIPASYTCACRNGYTGDGNKCTDVDECQSNSHNCHAEATCTNTKGSFKCTCNKGWTGNGQQCSDIDECGSGTHNCHQFAKCTNTSGSFSCDCISPGFRGDGFYCHDVDECSKGKSVHNCKVTERCYNLVGSHVCQCPKEVPMQSRYIDAETNLFSKLANQLASIGDEDFDSPINYHAQKLRTIFQLAKQVYTHHFKETFKSFYMVEVIENKLAMEIYDFRCTDVKQMSFPNYCHTGYTRNYWKLVTDRIDARFVWQSSVPFEQWATPPPTTKPPSVTNAAVTTKSMANGTGNTSTIYVPTTVSATLAPVDWLDKRCQQQIHYGTRGHIASPRFPNSYPLNTECKYSIKVPKFMDVYLNFTFFALERIRKCAYDYVKVYDGTSENDRLLATYCGFDTLPVPVRTNGPNMFIVFKSDSGTVMKGFNATWAALEPRVAVAFFAFNLESFTSNSKLHTKYLARVFEMDRKVYIPIARMLACVQYPQCNNSIPMPIKFTFEHTINDREEKTCVTWDINAYGTTWSSRGCTVHLTNKTHTICNCWNYGIVTVLGRDKAYYAPEKPAVIFALGKNCYLSLVLVILTLIGTLLFLLFKDSWIPYFLTILRDRDYDSGRIIQMHIVLNVLLTEIFFSAITFNLTASQGACFFMAFLFYYLLQTVFSWLFIYTLFLQSRIAPIFDSNKYNTYKIYLFMGYGIPFFVTLTVSGLNYKMVTNERMCWIFFTGTTVWGYSGSVVTLALSSIILLLVTIYHAQGTENGLHLQEKCLKNLFTTFFCLMTAVSGALAIQNGQYSAQYMFSLSNLLQCYSVVIIYCILTREQPMVQTNKVAAEDDQNELSALGMLADMAMKKYLEEKKTTNLDDLFGVENTSNEQQSCLKPAIEHETECNEAVQSDLANASPSTEDSDSEDDREDGKIHFRYDEYHDLQKNMLSEQQGDEEGRMEEETV